MMPAESDKGLYEGFSDGMGTGDIVPMLLPLLLELLIPTVPAVPNTLRSIIVRAVMAIAEIFVVVNADRCVRCREPSHTNTHKDGNNRTTSSLSSTN